MGLFGNGAAGNGSSCSSAKRAQRWVCRTADRMIETAPRPDRLRAAATRLKQKAQTRDAV